MRYVLPSELLMYIYYACACALCVVAIRIRMIAKPVVLLLISSILRFSLSVRMPWLIAEGMLRAAKMEDGAIETLRSVMHASSTILRIGGFAWLLVIVFRLKRRSDPPPLPRSDGGTGGAVDGGLQIVDGENRE